MNMEHVKVVVSVLTPVILLLLGIWAKGIATNHEKRISLNDRIIEKRVSFYEEIGKDLNDIYVFLIQVGHWKSFSPDEIVKKKRKIDKLMYVTQPYWSDLSFKKYEGFMSASFETWTGVGEDAKIRASTYQFEDLPNWKSEWKSYFSKKGKNIEAIKKSHGELMSAFSSDFGFIQE